MSRGKQLTYDDIVSKLDVTDSGCWINNTSAQSFRLNGSSISYVRFLCEQQGKTFSYRGTLYRTCGNVLCINPDHIIVATPKDRFMEKVTIDESTGCWNWRYARASQCAFLVSPTIKTSSRRVAWLFKHGILPSGYLESICGNDRCVNPDHQLHVDSDEIRFWKFVEKSDGCWLWTGTKDTRGYGKFLSPAGAFAHRFSYFIQHGPIPPGMVICHHCDNPSCVNPDHLFIGTVADNNLDKIKKGRHHGAVGERNGSAKLSDKAVKAIRYLYESGEFSTYDLEEIFCVARPTIARAIKRVTWKNVKEERYAYRCDCK